MIVNKNYIHYKIPQVVYDKKVYNHQKTWDLVGQNHEFYIKLINRFNRESYDDLVKFTTFAKFALNKEQLPYKGKLYLTQREIGFDMLEDDFGIISGNYGNRRVNGKGVSCFSISIPKKETNIIEWFDENKLPHFIISKIL